MKAGGIAGSKWLPWAAGAAVIAMLIFFVPLFHIVPLEAARERSAAADFDPVARVEAFWAGPLRNAAGDAVDAAELLSAFEQGFADAAARYGRRLGLASTSSYLVSGEGRITAVDPRSVAVSIDDDDAAEVVIDLGPVFGNAIRDGSGLLDVSDFANAQDFNALSAEINRRVEEEVLPALAARAEVGKKLRFAGGVEIADSSDAPGTLHVVPVLVEFP